MDLPVDGSAPDIAGQNQANPLGAIGSVAAMLSCSFGSKVTADLRPSGAPVTSEQVGESVCAAIG